MLKGVLVNDEIDVNMMTILAMRYVGLKIQRPLSITLKIINKRIYKLQDMISNISINVLRIFTTINFHVVLEDDGLYIKILSKSWLIKTHVQNYWRKYYMTIRKGYINKEFCLSH